MIIKTDGLSSNMHHRSRLGIRTSLMVLLLWSIPLLGFEFISAHNIS
jgi:hypothetical protein